MIRMVFKAKYSRDCGRTKRETKGKITAFFFFFLLLGNKNLILLMELIFH